MSVPRGVSGALRALGSGVSVPRVSPECLDTFLTMWGHFFLDTSKPEAQRPPETCRRTHPLGDTVGPVWAREAPVAQEPLNAPFLNGLFSSGFSRGKTAP